MIFHKKLAILGGDTRQIALAASLAEQKMRIQCYGLPQEALPAAVTCCEGWQEAVEGATLMVLPLPASPDGRRLNLPLMNGAEAPLLTDIFEAIPERVVIAGGKFTPAVKHFAEERGVALYDYFESEDLQQKNALPTAEGAVSILMREVPRTVSGLSVGVTGFGRVAKALIRLLLAMGAKVTVTARKQADVEAATALGCKTVLLKGKRSLSAFTKGQSVIFNTVPYWLFDEETLADVSPKTLMIDLASAPGGVDANAAAVHGIRVIWALSLPGKYAPLTAGEIIAETVLDFMKKEGIL